MLKPQDILTLLKLLLSRDISISQGQMALDLGMSASEVNSGLKRLVEGGLAIKLDNAFCPVNAAIPEFCVHALKYVFPVKFGEPSRGMLAGASSTVFEKHLSNVDDMPTVWPYAEGTHRGVSLQPLYRSVPIAAQKDERLYRLLCIIDVLRGRSARASKVAEKLLKEELSKY